MRLLFLSSNVLWLDSWLFIWWMNSRHATKSTNINDSSGGAPFTFSSSFNKSVTTAHSSILASLLFASSVSLVRWPLSALLPVSLSRPFNIAKERGTNKKRPKENRQAKRRGQSELFLCAHSFWSLCVCVCVWRFFIFYHSRLTLRRKAIKWIVKKNHLCMCVYVPV